MEKEKGIHRIKTKVHVLAPKIKGKYYTLLVCIINLKKENFTALHNLKPSTHITAVAVNMD